MDGTFGGGDLISASLAIMLGGTDAELHDKEVTLTTSDVTGSQTAIFEYDPQNEPVAGDPAGPWDGYSLFTIDLSGVKDDIEDLQQQVSDLEDELEEMQECCDEVLDVIHDYDPTYDPHPDPPDPTNPTIPEKIQEIIDEESGYTFEQDPTSPTYPDPDFPDKIRDLIGNDNLTDDDAQIEVRYIDEPHPSGHNIYYGFYTTDGTFLDKTQSFASSMNDKLEGFKILDYTTGSYEFYWVLSPVDRYYRTGTSSHLIGYGDPTHSYTVSKNS